jgi:vacuolar protein sorting-associated protein 13D
MYRFLARELVIDYIQQKLVLAPREENKRSQLWRMTSGGLLVHTGSSLPRDWSNKNNNSDDIRNAWVLDIEESSNSILHGSGPGVRYLRLAIRRVDPKRTMTQTWTFHEDGYLCMGKTQMCVQVFDELKEGKEVLLGPRRFHEHGASLPPSPTMHIRPRRRLKGSGLLSVRTYADGPTRVLEIANVKTSASSQNANPLEQVNSIANALTADISPIAHRLELRLAAGIGVSIISSMGHESEELVYIIFNDIHLEYKDENDEHSINGTIGTIIVSNQLLTTLTPCLLYAASTEDSTIQAAVHVRASLQKSSSSYK